MKTFIILCLGLISFQSFAQSAEEEAMILNQELQFLEDSVQNVQAVSSNTLNGSSTNRALNRPSLERTYFGEDLQEDVINTRSAGQKRRRVTE
jgi:hypothetical protein